MKYIACMVLLLLAGYAHREEKKEDVVEKAAKQVIEEENVGKMYQACVKVAKISFAEGVRKNPTLEREELNNLHEDISRCEHDYRDAMFSVK